MLDILDDFIDEFIDIIDIKDEFIDNSFQPKLLFA